MTLTSKRPIDCSLAEIEAFCRLATAAGEVDPDGLSARVRNARLLAFDYRDEQIVGISALKVRPVHYRKGIFRKARSRAIVDAYPYEVGWVFVAEAWRGNHLSRPLVDAALAGASGEGAYATSRQSKVAMHRTLRNVGFSIDGEPYQSERHRDDVVLLFLRPG